MSSINVDKSSLLVDSNANKSDLVITGVGGQGVVLASKVLAQAAINAGLEVRTSETIGMAQREGSVNSFVRMGQKLYGPLIPDGHGDILLSFELAETVRGLNKLKKSAHIVVNDQQIIPTTVALGRSSYEGEEIKKYLLESDFKVNFINAYQLAVEAGNPKAVNTVLLGALSGLKLLPFSSEELFQALMETVPAKTKELNGRAFQLGRKSLGSF